MRIIRKIAFSLVLLVVSFTTAFGEKELPESFQTASQAILLRIPLHTNSKGVLKFTIQVKANISVFGSIQEPIFTQISGEQIIERLPREGPLVWESLTTTCATMSSYSPGKPNQNTETDLLNRTLLRIGINPVSMPILRGLTTRGEIEILEGVPADRIAFFKETSRLGFPERPVCPGDEWSLTMQLPFEFEPNSPAVSYQNIATFSLDSFSTSMGTATAQLSINITGSDLEPATAPVHISSKSNGKIDLRLSDMQYISICTTGQSRVSFGSGNFFDTEERTEIFYTDLP